ncbi:hypothetical protein LRP88_02082 [Fusarium phalaenopsidis]
MYIIKAIQPTSLGFEKAQPITITPIKSRKKTAWHEYGIFSILLVLSFFGLSQRLRSSCSKTTPDVDLGRLGAVSTEISRCSRIGVDIMKKGGNAADAAIASTLCVGTVGMYHSGIGGGGFAVIRSSNGSYETIDFRETAPRGAYEDMFEGRVEASIKGELAVGVPGELRGLQYIHQQYGSLPWNVLVSPAVDVARHGFTVGADLERCINSTLLEDPDDPDFFVSDPSWALDFAPDGKKVRMGDVMFRKRYADTLEHIAQHGADAFYGGPIADGIVRATNGSITLEDLAEYSMRRLETSNITYRGHRLFSTTAPSSGAIALSALKVVDGFDDFFAPGAVNLSTHHLVEAMKFAFAQRAKLGDPSFVPGLDTFQAEILSDAVAERNRNKILDNSTLDMADYNPDFRQVSKSHGTSHISTVDHTGLGISLTTTINLYFGSHVMVSETGIILNDVMNDFSIPGMPNEYGYAPSPENYVKPLKRPLSSTTPIFCEDLDGDLRLVIGAAGGSRIISSTIQTLLHVIDQKMTMAQALRHPRLHDQLIPVQTGFESDYDSGVVSFLAELGHNVTVMPSTLSAVQGIIRRPDGSFDAASEPRQKDSGAFSI